MTKKARLHPGRDDDDLIARLESAGSKALEECDISAVQTCLESLLSQAKRKAKKGKEKDTPVGSSSSESDEDLNCPACGDTLLDTDDEEDDEAEEGNVAYCDMCEKRVCQQCTRPCDQCGIQGCPDCIVTCHGYVTQMLCSGCHGCPHCSV